MDAPISSDASVASTAAGPSVDWVERHRRLRAQLRWLLPVGGLLMLLLAYQLAVYPSRAALSGYRYQQVGVQPDSTWWILAYRDGKAEILFSRDTARGWQRRELGVDSAQARSLALNWGGKAILVGDGGAVRVYDSLFRPVDSVRYTVGRQHNGRWIAADNSGQRALAIGDSGKALFTADGGKVWQRKVPPTGLSLRPASAAPYWRARAAFRTNGELILASSADYVSIGSGTPLPYAGTGLWTKVGGGTLANAAGGLWASAGPNAPIIYFRVSPEQIPQLLRQDGSAESGRRHYAPAELTNGFPAAAHPIDAAFSPTRPGFCLLISRNRVFAGRLGGPFTGIETVVEVDSTEAPDSKKLPKALPSKTTKTDNKKTLARANKNKKAATQIKSSTVITIPNTTLGQDGAVAGTASVKNGGGGNPTPKTITNKDNKVNQSKLPTESDSMYAPNQNQRVVKGGVGQGIYVKPQNPPK